ncbi:MAG: peptidyl-prolyl cis-trans isomerase [Terriglobia bacterium]
MKVGSEQVTQADIDSLMKSLNPQQREQVEKQGRRSLGQWYANMLVLSQAAQSQHLDATQAFRRALNQSRTNLLAELEYRNLEQKAAVSPDEVNRYYSTHQSEFQEAQIRPVVIRKKAEGSNAGFTAVEARARAEAIRKALVAGQDPQKVAHEFSVPNQVVVQTTPQTIQNTTAIPDWVRTAFQMKDGEVSPIQDTPSAIVFFQVEKRSQVDIKDATPEIENALRQQKLNLAVQNLKKTTPVWMDPTYFAGSSSSVPTKP